MLSGISGSNSVPNVVSLLVRVAEERSAEIRETIEKPKEEPKEKIASGDSGEVDSRVAQASSEPAPVKGVSVDIVV